MGETVNEPQRYTFRCVMTCSEGRFEGESDKSQEDAMAEAWARLVEHRGAKAEGKTLD